MFKEYDSFTGVVTEYKIEDGKLGVNRKQECQDIVDSNKLDRDFQDGKRFGDMTKVASIPLIVWEQWINELKRSGRHKNPTHTSNKGWFAAKLNSRDYSALRTKTCKI